MSDDFLGYSAYGKVVQRPERKHPKVDAGTLLCGLLPMQSDCAGGVRRHDESDARRVRELIAQILTHDNPRLGDRLRPHHGEHLRAS